VLGAVACGTTSSRSSSTAVPATSAVPESTQAGPGSTAAVDTSVPTGGTHLRVGYTTTRGASAQALRLASGAFDATPYQITWTSFASGDAMLQAVAAGSLDIALDVQPPNVVIAQGNAATAWTSSSAPFVVAGATHYTTQRGIEILARPASGIHTVADLKGKKVAYSKGSMSQYVWNLAAKQAGLTPGSVQEVKLTVADAKAAFVSGAVDAIVAYAYNLVSLQRVTHGVELSTSGAAIALYGLEIVPRALLDDPAKVAAVSDLVHRLGRAWAWFDAHRADVIRAVETLDHTAPVDAPAVVDEEGMEQSPLDSTLISALQVQADLFHLVGVSATKVDVSTLINHQFGF